MNDLEECKEWLYQYLTTNGTSLVDWVRGEALKMGFKKNILKQARKELGVKTFHQFDEYGPTPNYFWYLEES